VLVTLNKEYTSSSQRQTVCVITYTT